jgi:hypothetical protein
MRQLCIRGLVAGSSVSGLADSVEIQWQEVQKEPIMSPLSFVLHYKYWEMGYCLLNEPLVLENLSQAHLAIRGPRIPHRVHLHCTVLHRKWDCIQIYMQSHLVCNAVQCTGLQCSAVQCNEINGIGCCSEQRVLILWSYYYELAKYCTVNDARYPIPLVVVTVLYY